MVQAEIHFQLFSAVGLQDSPLKRIDNAKKLAMRLQNIQASLKVSLAAIIDSQVSNALYGHLESKQTVTV